MDKNKPNLFLDLDNTIVYSFSESKLDYFTKHYKDVKKLSSQYYIIPRPHLQIFLDFVFKYFNVNIWTAAQEKYAKWIIKHYILIKPERRLFYLLHSEHCKASNRYYGNLKELRLVYNDLKLPYFNEKNSYIIDDLKQICFFQLNNCLNVRPFDGTNPNDKELLRTIEKLKSII